MVLAPKDGSREVSTPSRALCYNRLSLQDEGDRKGWRRMVCFGKEMVKKG
jgi:hypothetical protein